jgi:hypothetical protein
MNTEWVKSSRSGGNGGSCVEVRQRDGRVEVRDSKDQEGPVLSFEAAAWAAFVDGVAKGELGL